MYVARRTHCTSPEDHGSYGWMYLDTAADRLQVDPNVPLWEMLCRICIIQLPKYSSTDPLQETCPQQ